ncbi:siderophore ABC transporter substrate-binding protein [Paenibacillus sp. MSJ-34]|uniref:siderophore ABC transporter substrate-binding protein n=1 Tax=Paenibacillus sp. MSJ-34 TaxID=2841529 RepID=UPI0034614A0C
MTKKLTMLCMTVLFILVIAACGAKNSGGNEGDANAQTTAAETNVNGTEKEAEAPQEDETITITHQLGETPVKKNPGNVVVLDYGALETLDKLGVEVVGLPKSSLPPHLKKFEDAKYTDVGTLKEPDFEKINSIKPGLIIISGRTSEAYEELGKIAPTIYMGVDTKKYMESFTENVNTIASIFGKEDEAQKELAAINESIQKIHETATAGGKKGLIILTTGGKVSAYGPGSRFGIIHDVVGVAPVDDTISATTHGDSISFEYVVEKNPDYLFVVDRDAVVSGENVKPAKEIVENDLVKKTNAYKDGKIIYLDPSYWYLSGGGLLSVPEMLKEVEEGIK